jgi:hypothetical protein
LTYHDLDRARQSLAAKLGANLRTGIGRLATRAQKTDNVLQGKESLLRRALEAEMQPEAVEVVGASLIHDGEIVHGDDRIPADTLLVMLHELDRLLPAEHVNRGLLLQIANQSEVLQQHLVAPGFASESMMKTRNRDCSVAWLQ